MTAILYGIKNCDTVRKARRCLDDMGVTYRFHDFRRDGLDAEMVRAWIDVLGWETVINRRSSSWKTLSESDRAQMDKDRAVKAAVQMPTLIKRPLLQCGQQLELGFDMERYRALFRD